MNGREAPARDPSSGNPPPAGTADRDRTIRDFGEQWTAYTANEGFYASQALFEDILHPFLTAKDFAGKTCADIGAGSGRITAMMAAAGAKTIYAIEPSQAVAVLRANTAGDCDRIRVIAARGDDWTSEPLDLVLSIGVLHHIPEPGPVLRTALENLKPGGRLLVWVYGREGNGAYLAFAEPLRRLTRQLPVAVNAALAWAAVGPLSAYAALCAAAPARLPLARYMRRVIAPLSLKARQLVVVDQLNPRTARYYRSSELEKLLVDAGFTDIRLHHRHGYSWTATGWKPA